MEFWSKNEAQKDILSRMKSLSLEELKEFLPFLKKELVEKHLSQMTLLEENVLAFRPSGKGRKKFVIDLENEAPLVYFGYEGIDVNSLTSPFFEALKREISNPYVEDISLWNEDRILLFKLVTINKVFKEEKKSLVLELFPAKANLLLLDENNKILLVFRPKGYESKRPLMKGLLYEAPCKMEEKKYSKESSFNIEKYLEETTILEKSLLEKRKKSKFEPFIKEYKRQLKRSERKLEAIQEDIEEAKKHLEDGNYGDAIYMNYGEIPAKADSFLFEGKDIPLDKSISLSQNAERYYKKAKKAKETLERGKTNLEKALEEKENAKAALYQIEKSDEASLERFALEHHLFAKKDVSKTKEFGSASLPYFVTYQGVKILFGKNAKQNDTLSFLLETSKNHLWFHILGERGSHVLLKTNTPTAEQIQMASEIALLLSNKEDGDVQMTPHKNIRKGNVPGLVIVKEFQTIHVKNITLEAKELLLSAKKVSE